MNIDAHQHFWKYDSTEYDWLDESLSALRRDFLPEELGREIRSAGIDGVVSVQARQCLEETEWLLSLAEEHHFIKGVVGWVPLTDPMIEAYLSQTAARGKLKGVRHVIQAEPDDQFILRKDFNDGIAMLTRFELVYDILIYERHLPYTIEFVDCHPEQIFVLDHIAKPRIRENLITDWAANIRQLAQRPNVYCKVSGMVTEADFGSWTIEQLRPYWDVVLTAFGPERLIFGSDWPVCTVACDYRDWHATVGRLAEELSVAEQSCLFGKTACDVYRLNG